MNATRFKKMSLSSGLLGLFVAASSFAQPAPPHIPPAPITATAPAAIVTIAGNIVRTKQVDVRNTPDKNLVALVEMADGQRQVVELGPALNFKSTPVRSGDSITVHGPRLMVGQVD